MRSTFLIILIKTIVQGYLNNPEANAKSFSEDGFFKTGDVAVIDDEGFFTIVDRVKELIKYKVCARMSRQDAGVMAHITICRVTKYLRQSSRVCYCSTLRSMMLLW